MTDGGERVGARDTPRASRGPAAAEPLAELGLLLAAAAAAAMRVADGAGRVEDSAAAAAVAAASGNVDAGSPGVPSPQARADGWRDGVGSCGVVCEAALAPVATMDGSSGPPSVLADGDIGAVPGPPETAASAAGSISGDGGGSCSSGPVALRCGGGDGGDGGDGGGGGCRARLEPSWGGMAIGKDGCCCWWW